MSVRISFDRTIKPALVKNVVKKENLQRVVT